MNPTLYRFTCPNHPGMGFDHLPCPACAEAAKAITERALGRGEGIALASDALCKRCDEGDVPRREYEASAGYYHVFGKKVNACEATLIYQAIDAKGWS